MLQETHEIVFNPDTINALSGLVTTITGLITVLGGIYIAVIQHRLGKKIDNNGAERSTQIAEVKSAITTATAEIKTVVKNGVKP